MSAWCVTLSELPRRLAEGSSQLLKRTTLGEWIRREALFVAFLAAAVSIAALFRVMHAAWLANVALLVAVLGAVVQVVIAARRFQRMQVARALFDKGATLGQLGPRMRLLSTTRFSAGSGRTPRPSSVSRSPGRW